MKAIVVSDRGSKEKLTVKDVENPKEPQGNKVRVKVRAFSVNPIDIKVRSGTYDDYPDYFEHVPAHDQIIGWDGAGIVDKVGDSVSSIKAGDEVFYSGNPFRPGSNAQYQLVDSRSVAIKPPSLGWAQAAAMPLTWITAWEALCERLDIQEGEQAALLIVNGAGGVGSAATQIARKVLKLPVVITTASREESTSWSKDQMGATHVVNHHDDIVAEVKKLNIPKSTPLKYIFITHSTTPYLKPAAALCEPFGKVCSIVQTKEMSAMYGTEFMAKSLSFIWCLIGTKPTYKVEPTSHGEILTELAKLIEQKKVKCTLTKELPLTLEGARDAHKSVEEGKTIGKVACSIDADTSASIWS